MRRLYVALVLLPLVTTTWTWLAFLRLAPAGNGVTGCLLEQYCHVSAHDAAVSQLPGLIYVALPLAVLGYLRIQHNGWSRAVLIAVALGIARFGIPLAVWLVGLHLEAPVPLRTIYTYCATETSCQVQPGTTYYFLTPLEVASGMVSLTLYVTTLTVWLHLPRIVPARYRTAEVTT